MLGHQCTHTILNAMNKHLTYHNNDAITEHMARTVVQIHDDADEETGSISSQNLIVSICKRRLLLST